MVWPSILPSVALYSALHQDEETATGTPDISRRQLSRLSMLGIGMIFMGVWQFIGPGFGANMLQYIPILCWLAPGYPMAQLLGSPKAGVGLGAFTLDWTAVTGSTMSIPFWAAVNIFISGIIFGWVLPPLSWRGNWFKAKSSLLTKAKVTLNSASLVSRTGERVSARTLVNTETHALIQEKYDAIHPVIMSPLFAWGYFGAMAQFSSAVTHTVVWHGKEIVKRARSPPVMDIHSRLIARYPEVPDSWYNTFFIVCGLFTIVSCQFSGVRFCSFIVFCF
jgi:hypothetical protein